MERGSPFGKKILAVPFVVDFICAHDRAVHAIDRSEEGGA
jgi:hypothetical protein